MANDEHRLLIEISIPRFLKQHKRKFTLLRLKLLYSVNLIFKSLLFMFSKTLEKRTGNFQKIRIECFLNEFQLVNQFHLNTKFT